MIHHKSHVEMILKYKKIFLLIALINICLSKITFYGLLFNGSDLTGLKLMYRVPKNETDVRS